MPSISHYYGDTVRQFFVGIAVLIGICMPFSGNLQLAAAYAVPAVVVLIVLAGLTNPHGGIILTADAIASVVGFLMAELVAIAAYNNGAYIPLAILECISVLFLVTSYYSIKTVRAMMMHKIGHPERRDEFDEPQRT